MRRVKEIIEWVQSGDYNRIVDGDYPRRGQEPAPSVEFAAAVVHYRERFSRFLDRTAGSVQDLGKQLGDWLKRQPADERDGNGSVGDE